MNQNIQEMVQLISSGDKRREITSSNVFQTKVLLGSLIARYVAMYKLGSIFRLYYVYVAIAGLDVEDFCSFIIPGIM